MLPVIETYLRPRKWAIYLLFIGPLTMLIIYFVMPVKEDILLYLFAGFTALMGGFAWLISRTYVLVDNEGLTRKSIFNIRNISWKEVAHSYLKVVSTGKSTERYWYVEDVTGKGLRFSTGNYSRASLTTIAEALITKCPDAVIDQKIRDFAVGKFPWYIL